MKMFYIVIIGALLIWQLLIGYKIFFKPQFIDGTYTPTYGRCIVSAKDMTEKLLGINGTGLKGLTVLQKLDIVYS